MNCIVNLSCKVFSHPPGSIGQRQLRFIPILRHNRRSALRLPGPNQETDSIPFSVRLSLPRRRRRRQGKCGTGVERTRRCGVNRGDRLFKIRRAVCFTFGRRERRLLSTHRHHESMPLLRFGESATRRYLQGDFERQHGASRKAEKSGSPFRRIIGELRVECDGRCLLREKKVSAVNRTKRFPFTNGP